MFENIRPSYLFRCFSLFFFFLNGYGALSQRCGTMPVLEQKFEQEPTLRAEFEYQKQSLTLRTEERLRVATAQRTAAVYTIPVVFHVVVSGRTVSDAAINAQLDILNQDFNLANPELSQVLTAFKGLAGNAGIQFCLAQRRPDGQPTTGIERYNTSVTRFSYVSEDVKYASRGGADAWDTNRYLNIWICGLSNNILGYASFPGVGVAREQGVVVDYSSLPGGGSSLYSGGKTLTHEMGHFFSLYHIWGDDDGSCTGTDEVGDTPNQSSSTTTCKQGEFTDNCSPRSPGIMYQNFMDYSPDACLSLFTLGQVARMQGVVTGARAILTMSDACTPPKVYGYDAAVEKIENPDQRICSADFVPEIRIKNKGSEILESLSIFVQIDGRDPVLVANWTGNLKYYEEAVITLPVQTVGEGRHELRVYGSQPNSKLDENPSNDQKVLSFNYYNTFNAPVIEDFETTFPSPGWDVVNPDNSNTWEVNSVASKSGFGSVRLQNYDYDATGQADLLRTPSIHMAAIDSAFVSFDYASSNLANSLRSNVGPDTLSVLVSLDCGKTYSQIYQIWGTSNTTRGGSNGDFVPAQSDWRRIELNLAAFIDQGDILVAFKNTNGSGQDVYLDNIGLRTVVVNANLKENGFLVTPNPADSRVEISFYPHPSDLVALEIFNARGQMVRELMVSNPVNSNLYHQELYGWPSGVYIVRARFADRIMTRKFIKR